MEDRLPTELWVKAHLRRCDAEAIPAVILRKGDATGGTVLLKLVQYRVGCRVLSQVRDLEGARKKLQAAGLDVGEIWDSGACRGLGVNDPAGNRVLLHRRYAAYPDGTMP